MEVKEYLKEVAYRDTIEFIKGEQSDVYKSKFDNSYITHVGLEDDIKYLADREITKELTHGVGFSPKDNKWYGWSHRAIYGFEVGSTCKKGDCHYVPKTPEELIDNHADFFADFFADISKECAEEKRAEFQILPDRSGIRILPHSLKIPVVNDLMELDSYLDRESFGKQPEEIDIVGNDFYEIKCGKGEWIAETMEDAKQMAIDFNEGVS